MANAFKNNLQELSNIYTHSILHTVYYTQYIQKAGLENIWIWIEASFKVQNQIMINY